MRRFNHFIRAPPFNTHTANVSVEFHRQDLVESHFIADISLKSDSDIALFL